MVLSLVRIGSNWPCRKSEVPGKRKGEVTAHRIFATSASMLDFMAVAQACPCRMPEAPAADIQIVVTGIRQSQAASIETKRNADAVVDVLTAEDIGKFGQECRRSAPAHPRRRRQPRVRRGRAHLGARHRARPQQARCCNGHSVATADWFILDQLAATRSFNYLIRCRRRSSARPRSSRAARPISRKAASVRHDQHHDPQPAGSDGIHHRARRFRASIRSARTSSTPSFPHCSAGRPTTKPSASSSAAFTRSAGRAATAWRCWAMTRDRDPARTCEVPSS